MHRIRAAFVVLGCLAGATGLQAQAPKPPIGACSLLPRDLVLKVTPLDKKIVDMVPPSEDRLGPTGSACSYGGIELQVDPFTPARLDALRAERGTTWSSVPDVGDAAYFFDNRGEYAELYARVGTHVFTIQMDVPSGGTVEGMKPKVVELARAIVPKLK